LKYLIVVHTAKIEVNHCKMELSDNHNVGSRQKQFREHAKGFH